MLGTMLRARVRHGVLRVAWPDGSIETFGDGVGPRLAVRLTRAGVGRMAINPELGVGEAYMEGDLVIEQGDIGALLELAGANLAFRPRTDPGALADLSNRLRRRLRQVNDRIAARRNVARHYDLSLDFYRRFLDEDLQYSCAYFGRPGMTLEQAQRAKKAHLAAKLRLGPALRVLDIGCGWGGLALTLAGEYGAEVTGVTLSPEQLSVARRRARDRGLARTARFSLTDYRDIEGPFDRIVSVGMFEHVGEPNYATFFKRIADLLTDDGVAVIHSIGCKDRPGVTNPFIRKHIFPGGYIPSLSQVTTAVERSGLWITDIEILRLHYASTLKCWRERFAAARGEIAEIYDERFCRMWEFYLAASEVSFRAGGHMVFQLQLCKAVDAVPIVRGYMVDDERRGPANTENSLKRAG